MHYVGPLKKITKCLIKQSKTITVRLLGLSKLSLDASTRLSRVSLLSCAGLVDIVSKDWPLSWSMTPRDEQHPSCHSARFARYRQWMYGNFLPSIVVYFTQIVKLSLNS